MQADSAVSETTRPPLPTSALPPQGPVLPIDVANGLRLDYTEARTIGESLSADYCFAEPFPHIVLDNFLPEPLARLALEHFPQETLRSDRVFETGYAGLHKRQILPEECDATARQIFHFFNSRPMLGFLEGLSAIQGLLPDPHFVGGGYHETTRGGRLGVHADFRINEQLHLHRRMNVLVYLNERWQDEWGGFLELWDRKMTASAKAVAPIFNRCVIFNTDADSFHGHPDPLAVPECVRRRSIALYYYTASRSIYDEVANTSTIYRARPSDDKATRREAFASRLEQHLRQWMPPVLLRCAGRIRRRRAS
jgi:2OG-Fe(II) oxygenase superfamily